MGRVVVPLVLLGAAAGFAHAQANYTDLGAAMQAAQAQAVRPGDEALDCDALEKELATVASDPAIQARVQASGATEQQRAPAQGAPSAGAAAALTLFSMMPGADMAGMAAQAAQARSQQAQAAMTMQSRMQQMQAMMASLPLMMRGQRVVELAQARKCDWIAGAMPENR
jgi:hypothetical protein